MHGNDNVATMLAAAEAGESVEIIGAGEGGRVELIDAIAAEHKVALRDLGEADEVVKYGLRVGRTTRAVRRGEWVHLHNLESCYDERSSTPDLHSGAPTDTVYR